MTSSARHVLLDDLPRQARTVVRVTGEDAERFLQGLLSANVGELTSAVATPATLLTVKGKIVSELWVLGVDGPEGEVEPWLAIPADVAEAVVAQLDDHIIMDDVELEVLEGERGALLWGSGLGERGAAVDGVRAFACTHPLPGRLLIGPGDALAAALVQAGSERADAEAFTRARVAQGRPAWGFEIVADRFPPEVGFVDAVSYDKGCFLGQEPLSRIHNRGQVNRVMVRVRAASAPAGELPVPLSTPEADAEVGSWTSWVAGDDGVEGLAIVKRAQAVVGTQLQAGTIAVEVSSGPLGDDPGGPGRGKSGTVALGGRRG